MIDIHIDKHIVSITDVNKDTNYYIHPPLNIFGDVRQIIFQHTEYNKTWRRIEFILTEEVLFKILSALEDCCERKFNQKPYWVGDSNFKKMISGKLRYTNYTEDRCDCEKTLFEEINREFVVDKIFEQVMLDINEIIANNRPNGHLIVE